MNVNRIFSAGRAPESPEQVQELLKNIITVTNYLPGVRNTLGWRGIFRIPYEEESWTFKSAEHPGVFGVDYAGSGEKDGVFSASFNMFYFPDSEEEVIEKFPINGAVYAYHDDYRELIRSFPEHPEFFNYFFIGKLIITYRPGDSAISIGIESLSEDIIISEEGVMIDGAEGKEYLIEPGEPEQAIPSFFLSSTVFNLLASSLSFHMEKAPLVRLRQYNAEKKILGAGNIRSVQSNGDVKHNSLAAMFYSNAISQPDDFFNSGKNGTETHEVTWSESDSCIPDEFSSFTFSNPEKIINTTSINRNLLGIETRPPLYIISGFLGAGKTTFIKNFLEAQSQKYLFGAVIQNELGEAGLDGTLISDECKVVEMDEGCVCCSLSGNLRRGINTVIGEFMPDFIILETTGAANPMNLTAEIHDLKDIVRFDSVTTIVDAHNIIESLSSYSIAKDQVKAADILILNKTDGLGEEQIIEMKKTLSGINSRALIYTSEYGDINPALLYDQDINRIQSNPAMNFALHNHKTHKDDGLSGVAINLPEYVNKENFLKKIDELPFDIFRIKGFLRFDGDEKYSVFQYVAGRYEISYHNDEKEPDDSFIVLIGKEMKNEKIEEYFRF
ncbi:MAG TPA: GTP-binding protein [Spirochaetota bacterium]|nr:GTP-binding protein [Spirochaetota bacterium]HPF06730.1 GTP-binding protein [Spirochaetota bacterium]HPJ43312.1 GTP-binding protein [Spirochaetota bacterium]HPR38649.1 GTP-binding protein [Spirochaetota bacterium]HRX48553.1 GTP-binding protein [Spirochaetota bacterium]